MVIKPFIVKQTKTIDNIRNGENDMIMLYRICFIDALISPECLVNVLTFGTVPVTAAIVTDVNSPAIITLVLMTAQG